MTTPCRGCRSSPEPSSWAVLSREIADLVGTWDGERFGPVQMRFHDLVTTKLADAERQIAELTAQLRHAAAQLADPALDGPCTENCACVTLDGAMAPSPSPPRRTHVEEGKKGDGFGVLGIGAAACVACCAGPILAILGGLGLAGVASTMVIGAAGLLLTVAAVADIILLRRRRTSCEVPEDGPLAVAIPTRRAPTT